MPIEVGTTLRRPRRRPVLERMWDEAQGRAARTASCGSGCARSSTGRARAAPPTSSGIDDLHVEDALSIGQRAKVEVDGDRVSAVFKVLGYVEETSDVETGSDRGVRRAVVRALGAAWASPATCATCARRLEGDHELLAGRAARRAARDPRRRRRRLPARRRRARRRHRAGRGAGVLARAHRRRGDHLQAQAGEPRGAPRGRAAATRRRQARCTSSSSRSPSELEPYYRDLGDHLLRVAELSAQHDDLLGTVLEAARSRQAVQQNEDMRKISAWVAIAAVPTAIAGIYGMNFQDMPELRWGFGYPAVMVSSLDGVRPALPRASSAAAGSDAASRGAVRSGRGDDAPPYTSTEDERRRARRGRRRTPASSGARASAAATRSTA